MEWRQGSDGKGEISPPMGSIVSRNMGWGREKGVEQGEDGEGEGVGASERLVVPHGQIPFGRGGA